MAAAQRISRDMKAGIYETRGLSTQCAACYIHHDYVERGVVVFEALFENMWRLGDISFELQITIATGVVFTLKGVLCLQFCLE